MEAGTMIQAAEMFGGWVVAHTLVPYPVASTLVLLVVVVATFTSPIWARR